jgi:predicted flap endonuclease-1-like 5' DNA nuclease
MTQALEDLPNIGKVLAHRLRTAGVTSPAQLLRLGDVAAFRKIRQYLPGLRARLKEEAHA